MPDPAPVDARRITVPIWLGLAAVGTLLALTAGGAWKAASAFGEIKQAFARNEAEHRLIMAQFWPRTEASLYSRDLEKALQRAGVHVDFPPPMDPLSPRPGS